MFLKLHYPPKYNYSLEKLKETDEEAAEAVESVIFHVADLLYSDERSRNIFFRYAHKIIQQGLILPEVYRNEEGDFVRFNLWSYIEGKFKPSSQMDEVEADIFSAVLEVFTNVN